MNSKEVLCEITFRDSQSNEIYTIVGKVRKKQIYSTNDSWISISNIIRKHGKWRNIEHTIHKASIHNLKINKCNIIYTFEKESLQLHRIIEVDSFFIPIA